MISVFPLNHKPLLVCHCSVGSSSVVQCTTCNTEHGSPASRVNPTVLIHPSSTRNNALVGKNHAVVLRMMVLMCIIQYN